MKPISKDFWWKSNPFHALTYECEYPPGPLCVIWVITPNCILDMLEQCLQKQPYPLSYQSPESVQADLESSFDICLYKVNLQKQCAILLSYVIFS